MKRLSAEVLKMFFEMRRDRLDLHVMFESSGNEPAARAQVLDAVEDLVREGYLQSAGGDFTRAYSGIVNLSRTPHTSIRSPSESSVGDEMGLPLTLGTRSPRPR